jgi:hypothetical protein
MKTPSGRCLRAERIRFRMPALAGILRLLPPLAGEPIRVRFLPELTARSNRFESGTGRGREVHAASFPRRREIVLDKALLDEPGELARIFVHELFHFAWVRLSNAARNGFEQLVADEFARGARGELGWSAQNAKQKLGASDREKNNRAWREYVCESYCDTAAWHLLQLDGHGEVTLGARDRQSRRRWFADHLGKGDICL